MAFDLQFSVHGSDPEPYRVQIGTEEGRVIAECTCRYGRTYEGRRSLCKHRRAILEANSKVLKVPATEFNGLKTWIARNQGPVQELLATRAVASKPVVPRPPSKLQVSSLSFAACIDIETTGFSPRSDAITEIAIALFRYKRDSGQILGIVDQLSSIQEPRVPIPPRVAQLTSITTQLKQGRVIDWESVTRIIEQADFLVAHNAEFERRFLSQIPELLDGKMLLCSQLLPTWHKPGIRKSVKLEDLTAGHAIPHDAHRAYGDVLAMVKLLATSSPITGAPYFAEVLRAARTPLFPETATQPRGQGRGHQRGERAS